jgi:hypothetical protein
MIISEHDKEVMPAPEDGKCYVLEYTEPRFERRTLEIVLREEWTEYIVTQAEFETNTKTFTYELGGRWAKDCCSTINCEPQVCYQDDTIVVKRDITEVTKPANLEVINHPAVIETIEYDYAVFEGEMTWVEKACASPKQ